MSKVFMQLCEQFVGVSPVAEFKFSPTRRFRFDFCFVKYMVAVEVEGGVWTGGRHTSGVGFVKDMEKYNIAASMGYRILRFQPKELLKMETINLIKETVTFINPHT